MADGMQAYGTRADVLTDSQQKQLRDNLDPSTVRQRNQGGTQVSYIEGWHAIKEANRIFGAGAWDRQLLRLEETNRDLVEIVDKYGKKIQWRVGYMATVRITVHGENGASRFRDGTGFGTGIAKEHSLGDAIESAIKEAETDAMKRALITFGNPFGLALYDKTRADVGPSKIAEDDEDEEAEQQHPVEIPKCSRDQAADEKRATAENYVRIMIGKLNACETATDLLQLVNQQRVNLERFKTAHPELHKKIDTVRLSHVSKLHQPASEGVQ